MIIERSDESEDVAGADDTAVVTVLFALYCSCWFGSKGHTVKLKPSSKDITSAHSLFLWRLLTQPRRLKLLNYRKVSYFNPLFIKNILMRANLGRRGGIPSIIYLTLLCVDDHINRLIVTVKTSDISSHISKHLTVKILPLTRRKAFTGLYDTHRPHTTLWPARPPECDDPSLPLAVCVLFAGSCLSFRMLTIS